MGKSMSVSASVKRTDGAGEVNLMRRCVFGLVCVVLVGVHSFGGVIEVDPAHPEVALAKVAPGDELILPEGMIKNLKLSLKADGTAEKPIILRAATAGKTVLNGSVTIVVSGSHIVVSGLVFDQAWSGRPIVSFTGATRCRLTDCAFIECGNPASTFTHIVELNGTSQHNRVDHCFWTQNLSMGLAVRVNAETENKNTDNLFDHNYFKDITHRSNNGQESVQLGQGPASETVLRTTVEFNLFERASGDPEIISNKTSENLIRYNTFRDCDWSEVVLRGGKRTTVEGNFIIGCKGGIRVHGEGHRLINNYIEGCGRGITISHGYPGYEVTENCIIVHNTLVNVKTPSLSLSRAAKDGDTPETFQPPRNILIANNLIVSENRSLAEVGVAIGTMWAGNIVWAGPKGRIGVEVEGVKAADPKMERQGDLLRPTAAARDAAMELNVLKLTEDIDGQPREGRGDVGCDEATHAPAKRKPLTPTEVGPTWMGGDAGRVKRIEDRKAVPPVQKKK